MDTRNRKIKRAPQRVLVILMSTLRTAKLQPRDTDKAMGIGSSADCCRLIARLWFGRHHPDGLVAAALVLLGYSALSASTGSIAVALRAGM